MSLGNNELNDLGKLAISRCRKAFMSVGQLVGDDRQHAVLLLTVVVDMVHGLAQAIEETDEKMTEGEAKKAAIMWLMQGLGIEVEIGSKKRSGEG